MLLFVVARAMLQPNSDSTVSIVVGNSIIKVAILMESLISSLAMRPSLEKAVL